MYTIIQEDGSRKTDIEDKLLREVDGKGIRAIREIEKRKPISIEIRGYLSIYLGCLFQRTPAALNRAGNMIEDFTEQMFKLEFSNEADIRKSLNRMGQETGNFLEEDVIKKLVENPPKVEATQDGKLQMFIKVFIHCAEQLFRMKWCIYVAPKGSGFITTNDPFTMIPQDNLPEFMGTGIMTAKENIVPLTSKLAISIKPNLEPDVSLEYVSCSKDKVREINRCIAYYSSTYLIGPSKAQISKIIKDLKYILPENRQN